MVVFKFRLEVRFKVRVALLTPIEFFELGEKIKVLSHFWEEDGLRFLTIG
jgi:hypothetical protein